MRLVLPSVPSTGPVTAQNVLASFIVSWRRGPGSIPFSRSFWHVSLGRILQSQGRSASGSIAWKSDGISAVTYMPRWARDPLACSMKSGPKPVAMGTVSMPHCNEADCMACTRALRSSSDPAVFAICMPACRYECTAVSGVQAASLSMTPSSQMPPMPLAAMAGRSFAREERVVPLCAILTTSQVGAALFTRLLSLDAPLWRQSRREPESSDVAFSAKASIDCLKSHCSYTGLMRPPSCSAWFLSGESSRAAFCASFLPWCFGAVQEREPAARSRHKAAQQKPCSVLIIRLVLFICACFLRSRAGS